MPCWCKQIEPVLTVRAARTCGAHRRASEHQCERGGGRTRRPLDRLASAGATMPRTTRFLNKRGTGDWPVPPRVALPTGATNVGNTTQLDPDGDGPCGPSPRFVPLA